MLQRFNKPRLIIIGVVVLIVLGTLLFGGNTIDRIVLEYRTPEPGPAEGSFGFRCGIGEECDEEEIFMTAFTRAYPPGGPIPAKHTCDGINVSPKIQIGDVPLRAESLALIMHDPDTPQDWVHWTMWNIDPAVEVIEEDSVPAGAVEGVVDFGGAGYSGPCPPFGDTHEYVITIFALDTELAASSATTAEELRNDMANHILDTAELRGVYERQE